MLLQNARSKVKEADELAKRYWAVRDESKRLESYAKRLAGEAADDARDAIKKRNEVSYTKCFAVQYWAGKGQPGPHSLPLARRSL